MDSKFWGVSTCLSRSLHLPPLPQLQAAPPASLAYFRSHNVPLRWPLANNSPPSSFPGFRAGVTLRVSTAGHLEPAHRCRLIKKKLKAPLPITPTQRTKNTTCLLLIKVHGSTFLHICYLSLWKDLMEQTNIWPVHLCDRGLCKTFRVGNLADGKLIRIYRSNRSGKCVCVLEVVILGNI